MILGGGTFLTSKKDLGRECGRKVKGQAFFSFSSRQGVIRKLRTPGLAGVLKDFLSLFTVFCIRIGFVHHPKPISTRTILREKTTKPLLVFCSFFLSTRRTILDGHNDTDKCCSIE